MSPGVSSRIQEVSLDVANVVVCLWMSPAGLQVPPANPGGIIGCSEHQHIFETCWRCPETYHKVRDIQ